MTQSAKRKPFNIRLPLRILKHLRVLSERNSVTMTSIVEDALENYFAGVHEDPQVINAQDMYQ